MMKAKNIFKTLFGKKVDKAINFNEQESIKSSIVSFVNFNQFNFPYKSLNAYYRAYQIIPQLRAIIDSSAKAFARSEINIEKINPDGSKEIVTSGKLYETLAQPHPLTDSKTFKELFYKHWQLFDRVHVVKNIPSGFDADNLGGLFILPTPDVFIVPKKGIELSDIAFATDINEIIDSYKVKFGDEVTTFQPEDVWTLSNGSLKLENIGTFKDELGNGNFLYPDEKMKSLKKPLEIIASSYDSELEMKLNYGALGIINSRMKDGQGADIRLEDDEIQQIQDDYKRYGTSKEKWKMMFSQKPLDFTPISLPYDKLKLPEGIQKQKVTLCDAFSFPILLLNELEASTFSNLGVSSKILYTDKIIPETNRIQNSMNQNLNLINKPESIIFDFGHIEVLQADKQKEATKNKTNSLTLIGLNTAVSEGKMSRESAIEFMIDQFKLSKKQAEIYISIPILQQNEQAN